MEGGWKTHPPPPSATTRQKSPVLIGLSKHLMTYQAQIGSYVQGT